jgi:four helix bundle protein
MAKYERFDELPVWQEAARLYNQVLDLLEVTHLPVSYGFKNQLDRAALSVSNNIAEGFERFTTNELLSFLAIARGSAGEVRSMIAVVQNRPRLKPVAARLQEIRRLAESCGRQLTGWTGSIEQSPVKGKRHLAGEVKQQREAQNRYREWRSTWLRSLKPEHPLYKSSEAREARGEVDG